MAYTCSLADADGDRYHSAKTSRSTRRCDENNNNNRLDQRLVDNERDRRRQARWCSSGVGVTFTLSGTICPLHGEHNPDPAEDPPTPPEIAASSAGFYRRSRNAYTSERDTGWRDPHRGLRDTYRDDQEGEKISLSLGYGWAEPGNDRTRCPTRRPHQCPAVPTRLSPRYGGEQWDTRGSAGSGRQVRVPPHVSTAQHRPATETEQKNSGASRGRFRDLGTSAPPVASYVSRESTCEPLVREKSWAVSYFPSEEAAPPPTKRGRGVARGSVVRDHRVNPEREATSAAADPKFSLRSLEWNAHLEEARIMKHVSGVSYSGGFSLQQQHQ